ncbi:MAG: 5'/3'-nucleotidase SurE [Candidatus Aminicenantes bacterium]|nr:5'/3'-nucleotidase SurE [Candidatus Aminicenantes bacterium]
MLPIFLLTNDDGFFSPGLEALQTSLQDLSEIYVIAPDREKSATSLSLSLHRPLRIQTIRSHVYAVDGTPADCVYLAVKKLLPRPPDLVISGINHGPNLGHQDVAYSGTVAAALQAAFLGLRSIAISLLPDNQNHYLFSEAAKMMKKIIAYFLDNPFPPGIALNFNLPPPPVKGIKVVPLGEKRYNPQIIENTDPRGRKYYWIGSGKPEYLLEKETDIEAVKEGFIALTPLKVNFTAIEYCQSYLWQGLYNLFT